MSPSMGRDMRSRWVPLSPVLLCAGILALPMGAFAATLPFGSQNLTVFKTCTLLPNPSTSTVEVDGDVRQGNANTNFGTGTSMNVTSSNSANRRNYLRFDLTKCSPVIPASATIKVATLKLYTSAIPAVCRTHDIFRVTASWTETGITWNNQPFGTSINNPAQSARTSSMDIGSGTCQNATANAYVSGWAVTTDVAAFAAGTATNNGWMIRDDVEGSGTARVATYATKDGNLLTQAPVLSVTYVQ